MKACWLKIATVWFMQRNLKSRWSHLQCGLILIRATSIIISLVTIYMHRDYESHGESCHGLTSPPSKARMKAQLSLVQDRTVSVLPSLNRRVIVDSYVKLNLFWSCNQKMKKKTCKEDQHYKIGFSFTRCLFENTGKLNKLTVRSAPREGLPYSRPTAVQSEWRHLGWLDTSWPLLCQSLWRQQRACPHH